MIGFDERFLKSKESYFFTKYDKNFILVDTLELGFYDNILNFESDDESIRLFISAVKLLKNTLNVHPFYKPIMDLTVDMDGRFVISPNMNFPLDLSVDLWEEAIKRKMPKYYGCPWVLGDQYQYYAFLVYLINRMVKFGWKLEDAIDAVVNNSNKIRQKEPVLGMTTNYEEFLGLYNLTVTAKYLRNGSFSNIHYISAGYGKHHDTHSLADLRPYIIEDSIIYGSRRSGEYFTVPWIVLEI